MVGMSRNAFHMVKFSSLVIGLIAAANIVAAAAVDEEKPHGRVCLSIYEPGPPEKEEAFNVSTPAAGKTVRAYVDASDKCSVLVAAITKEGKLANGWRPQLADVPGDFEEILLPKGPVKWDWSAASGPFDFFVLFLAPRSKEVEEAKKLVEAMENPKVDDRVLALQTSKLKELIGRITSTKEKVNQAPVSEPEVGGVFRGAAFPWRQYAQGINFAADKPGVLVLSSDTAEKK
jgi:hypothetical protein